MMEQISLTKSLFDTYRINLSAYMLLPDVTKSTSKNTFGINANPVLYMRYKGRKEENVNWNDSAYKINPKNLYRTIKFFNRIVSWFYDEDLKDLFLMGEKNELIFNSDYNKLSIITDRNLKNNSAMKAVPAVVTSEDGRSYEGIILYINKPEYAIPMTLEEVESILGILAHFSFEALISDLLLSFFVAGSMGRITQADQNNKSYMRSSGNTNYVTKDQWQ